VNILRWIVAEAHPDKDMLCSVLLARTRASAQMMLRDYLKHYESLSLDDDFTRHKLSDGTLKFRKDRRVIYIAKFMFKGR